MSYLSIAVIIAYICSYQFGLGPIPLFIASGPKSLSHLNVSIRTIYIFSIYIELFENGPKPAAMSMGSFFFWTGNFVVGMLYPILQLAWGAYAFLPFACVCFSLVIFLRFYLPETRGRVPSEVAPLVSKGLKSRPLQSIS